MPRIKDNSKFAFYGRVALILHALVLILFILRVGRILFIPLFFALLIAILLYPLTRFLERWRIKKNIAAVLSVLLFLSFIGAIVFFFTKELVHFLKDLPAAQAKIQPMIHKIQQWIVTNYNIDDTQQTDLFKNSFGGANSNMISSIGTTFLSAIEFVVLFIFFLIFTFFILLHRRLLKSFILAFFDRTHMGRVNKVMSSTRSVINGYVLGLLTEMAVVFTLILTVLIILGVKYALLIAVIAAVLNIIPYLGIYIAAAFGMLIALTNGTEKLAIEVAISFIVIHFVDANILIPNIVGGRVKINPLITIVAIFAGRLVWGIPGMFLFIPLTAIIRIISENVDDLKPWAILIGEEKDDSYNEKHMTKDLNSIPKGENNY